MGSGIDTCFAGKGRHDITIGGGVTISLILGYVDVLISLRIIPLAVNCIGPAGCNV